MPIYLETQGPLRFPPFKTSAWESLGRGGRSRSGRGRRARGRGSSEVYIWVLRREQVKEPWRKSGWYIFDPTCESIHGLLVRQSEPTLGVSETAFNLNTRNRSRRFRERLVGVFGTCFPCLFSKTHSRNGSFEAAPMQFVFGPYRVSIPRLTTYPTTFPAVPNPSPST
jgi:hypothetical protein